MTTPDERLRYLLHAEQFMLDLARGKYKRVPKEVREAAKARLRHYPSKFDLTLMLNAQYDGILYEEVGSGAK